jgi:hypothetical protein
MIRNHLIFSIIKKIQQAEVGQGRVKNNVYVLGRTIQWQDQVFWLGIRVFPSNIWKYINYIFRLTSFQAYFLFLIPCIKLLPCIICIFLMILSF